MWGPNDGQAAFVDELGVGVDHRLDRALRQSLDLAVDDLDGPIDDALAPYASLEDHVERIGEIVAEVLGKCSEIRKSIR